MLYISYTKIENGRYEFRYGLILNSKSSNGMFSFQTQKEYRSFTYNYVQTLYIDPFYITRNMFTTIRKIIKLPLIAIHQVTGYLLDAKPKETVTTVETHSTTVTRTVTK